MLLFHIQVLRARDAFADDPDTGFDDVWRRGGEVAIFRTVHVVNGVRRVY